MAATSLMLGNRDTTEVHPWTDAYQRRAALEADSMRGEAETRSIAASVLTEAMLKRVRIPYALRRVPSSSFACVLPRAEGPRAGDIVLACVEKIGKNTRLELANGRPCALHVGDQLAVVFGNRYATMQFEGYARSRGDTCDLLSMGGLCGLVETKHDSVADSTKLKILGAIGDADGRPLRLRDFCLPRTIAGSRPQLLVVCGTSMDAGKTYTATSLIQGLCRSQVEVVGTKLTGTAAGRDTWGMLDAGACTALDFIDGGFASTYQATLEELLELHRSLLGQAAALGASWVVLELADGLLQQETAALLRCPEFTRDVTAFVFAAGDALSAAAGVQLLRDWGIEPIAVSGRVTMSPLAVREAEAATGLACLSASRLQAGELTPRLQERAEQKPRANGATGPGRTAVDR